MSEDWGHEDCSVCDKARGLRMSKLTFECEADLRTALEIEREAIERQGWRPDGSLLFTFISDPLVDDVKAELDARGITYQESE